MVEKNIFEIKREKLDREIEKTKGAYLLFLSVLVGIASGIFGNFLHNIMYLNGLTTGYLIFGFTTGIIFTAIFIGTAFYYFKTSLKVIKEINELTRIINMYNKALNKKE